MRLQSFLEQFDQFFEAPEAVAKMRELVLGFAFTGRLTNKIPKSDGVPDGWENRTIGSIASSMTPGFACSKSHQVKGGHVHLRTHNVSTLGTFNFDLLVRIDPQMVDPQKATISRGDILFNNTNSQELVGKTCLVDRDYEYGFSNHITRIRLKPSVNPSFVVFYLTWLRNNGHFARLCTRWINQAAINTNTLKDQMIPLPPLGEQEQIVAKINELMSLCDHLETQQKERVTRCVELTRAAIARLDENPTSANLDFLFCSSYSVTPADLRKAVLNLAVRGKLVSQDPHDELATTLLSKIHEQKEKLAVHGKLKADKKTWARTSETPPFALPESWCWVRLQDVFEISRGGSPRPAGDTRYFGGSIPWITVGEITKDNGKYLTSTSNGLTSEGADRSRFINVDDLLLTNSGATLGVPKISKIKGCINDGVAVLRQFHTIDVNDFAYLYLASQTQHFREVNQGMGQPNLNTPIIAGWYFPLPPLAEQKKIVVKVNLLMALVDQLESLQALSERAADELLDAVVHELLHLGAIVFEFPRSEPDSASQRAAIGCYAIKHLARNPSFGRTMLMKACYLAETHLGLPLGWQPMRQAAGPWDPWVQDFESLGTLSNWFTVTEKTLNNGRSKIEYSPQKALKSKADEAVIVLGSEKVEFDRLLSLFADKNTEEAEIITTLFAAWNDFLIDGRTPTDNEIIHEVREKWHQSKERFAPALLLRWLDWMRSHALIPKGRGPRTRQQLTLRLNESQSRTDPNEKGRLQ